ncbi:MAG: hypothetical protein WCT19_03815 [Candidatus Paceibacterota bacterium]
MEAHIEVKKNPVGPRGSKIGKIVLNMDESDRNKELLVSFLTAHIQVLEFTNPKDNDKLIYKISIDTLINGVPA